MKHIPELKKPAQNLVFLCLFIIFIYTASAYFTVTAPSPLRAIEFLESTLAATAISLGGGLLLDIELRHSERKN